METLDLTLSTPEENLACDEALLRLRERNAESGDLLRFWEPQRHFVVLGLSNAHQRETRFQHCLARKIPVLRRCSGGGAVLQGPGCLNYALVLRVEKPGPLENIPAANRFILERHRRALGNLLSHPLKIEGDTDLTLDGLKFSGNCQRRGTGWLLFHGTLLLRFDLAEMETLLASPSRQPAYRRGRGHAQFLTNLPVSAGQVKRALQETWGAHRISAAAPTEEISLLLESRYSRKDWNLRN